MKIYYYEQAIGLYADDIEILKTYKLPFEWEIDEEQNYLLKYGIHRGYEDDLEYELNDMVEWLHSIGIEEIVAETNINNIEKVIL